MIAADAPLAEVLTSLVYSWKAAKDYVVPSSFEPRWETRASWCGAESSRSLCESGGWSTDRAMQRSCGTAMFTRKPVIVANVMTDPLWRVIAISRGFVGYGPVGRLRSFLLRARYWVHLRCIARKHVDRSPRNAADRNRHTYCRDRD